MPIWREMKSDVISLLLQVVVLHIPEICAASSPYHVVGTVLGQSLSLSQHPTSVELSWAMKAHLRSVPRQLMACNAVLRCQNK